MKRFLLAALTGLLIGSIAFGADQIIQFSEPLVGANHPTLADTINRGFLIEHNADGTHKTEISTTLSYGNVTDRPTINSVTVTGDVLDNASNYPTLNQNTTGTSANVTGIVAVTNGGTGSDNATGARTNLGLVIGTHVLAPDGSAASLTSFPTLNQDTTGTSANVTGTVAVANGGTGSDNASGALANLGANDASNITTGLLGKSIGGFAEDISSKTGVPYHDNGTVTWKTLVQFLSLVGITYNSADNTWTFAASITVPSLSSTCSPTDNTCGFIALNSGFPTENLSAGYTAYDNSANLYKVRNGDNTATLEMMSSGITQFQKCITIDNAVAASDYPAESFPVPITIVRVKVYQTGADNVIGQWDECTGTNGACTSTTAVDTADITAADGVVAYDDGTLSNPGIAAGNILRWRTTSVGGTNTSCMACFYYTMDQAKP